MIARSIAELAWDQVIDSVLFLQPVCTCKDPIPDIVDCIRCDRSLPRSFSLDAYMALKALQELAKCGYYVKVNCYSNGFSVFIQHPVDPTIVVKKTDEWFSRVVAKAAKRFIRQCEARGIDVRTGKPKEK